MSRQFDEYMEDKFEVLGQLYSLVEPDNFDELIKAIQIRDVIQNGLNGFMHDEDSSGFSDLLQRQEEYIKEYLYSLGEFDNSYLISNINYLVKKNDLRIGDIEKLLGISAGYISRTAKENSAKKLSIDVVWKIAKLFDVDMGILIETDLQIPNGNTDMLIKFISKLTKQTRENTIEWSFQGGNISILDKSYLEMGLITEENEISVYHPNHLNQDIKWILMDDIVAFEKFEGIKNLVIIPYKSADNDILNGYDFVFVWNDGKKHHWEKVFYTADDPFGDLKNYTSILLDSIRRTELDAKVAPEIRNIIANYTRRC